MTFSNSSVIVPEYVDGNSVMDTSEQSPLGSMARTLCDPPSVSFNTNYSLTLMDPPSARFECDFQPAPDNGHAREFETAFCRDFSCCGLSLVDMHDLLQHYEECHVRFEDDVDDMFDDSEFFDEDGWSDTDTACPSPFPTSSSPFELAAGSGSSAGLGSTPDTSAFSSPSLSTATAAATQLAPRANQNPFFSCPYADPRPRPSPFSLNPSTSNSMDDLPLVRNNSIHPSSLLELSACFAPSKRKASSTDIYLEEEVEMETEESDLSEDSSAFSNTILRTRTSSMSSSSSIRSRTSLRLAKRQALGCGRSSSSSFPPRTTQVAKITGLFGKAENGESYSGLDQPSLDILDFSLNLFPNITTAQGPGPFDVDIRHREEVVSLLEDIGKASSSGDRPYRCTISGCDKAYKNPNGLKYHNQHGHTSGDDAPEIKPYMCTFLDCGRRYKNLNGLKYHVEHCHPNLIGALRAHHSGLTSNPYIFGPYSSHALTIEAALVAIESPMMLAATSALLAHTLTSSDKVKEKEKETTTSGRSRTRSTTPATAPAYGSGPGPGPDPEIGVLRMLMDMDASPGSISPLTPSGLAYGSSVESGSVSAGLGGGVATPGLPSLHPHPCPSTSDSR